MADDDSHELPEILAGDSDGERQASQCPRQHSQYDEDLRNAEQLLDFSEAAKSAASVVVGLDRIIIVKIKAHHYIYTYVFIYVSIFVMWINYNCCCVFPDLIS